jgi:hypothetical protein
MFVLGRGNAQVDKAWWKNGLVQDRVLGKVKETQGFEMTTQGNRSEQKAACLDLSVHIPTVSKHP